MFLCLVLVVVGWCDFLCRIKWTMWLTCIRIFFVQSKSLFVHNGSFLRTPGKEPSCCNIPVAFYLLLYLTNLFIFLSKNDRLNLEGYANLDYWVAELDKRIETILLQWLTHIIQVWCTEFDRVDDGGIRRDVPLRDITNKRRGDKWMKEKVSSYPNFVYFNWLIYILVYGGKYDT